VQKPLGQYTEALIQDQASRFTLELPGKRSSRTHLNTPSPVVGYHLKACPKSVNHYTPMAIAKWKTVYQQRSSVENLVFKISDPR
jgi:hypothetical protein